MVKSLLKSFKSIGFAFLVVLIGSRGRFVKFEIHWGFPAQVQILPATINECEFGFAQGIYYLAIIKSERFKISWNVLQ